MVRRFRRANDRGFMLRKHGINEGGFLFLFFRVGTRSFAKIADLFRDQQSHSLTRHHQRRSFGVPLDMALILNVILAYINMFIK